MTCNCHQSYTAYRLLVIGGDRREHHLRRITRAFPALTADWCPTRESDPSDRRFRHLIRNHAYNVVIALKGLMRHQHLADVRRLCAEVGTTLLVLNRSPSVPRIQAALHIGQEGERRRVMQ